MAIEEPGVLWRDGVYFYAASNFAKQHLFYPMWRATYELDSRTASGATTWMPI